MRGTESDETSEHSEPAAPGAFSLDELDHLVTWTLVRAARRVERMLVDLFAAHDLTPVQFGVLAHLAAGTELTQSELSRMVLIRPQSMNAVIAEMVDRGLLERGGPGGRGRPTPIRLTPAGIELLRAVAPAVRRANDPARLGLDARRAARLNDILQTVLDSDLPAGFELDFRPAGASHRDAGVDRPRRDG